MTGIAAENVEAREAWDGVLFDRFVAFRHLVIDALQPHGEAAIAKYPPPPGGRVLDVGCGFGDTTRRLAQLVGPGGSAFGVDVAPRFIAAAREENADLANASFDVTDVQVAEFADTFDHVFSRFGTMFFAAPGAAMRRVRAAMAPGALLCMVVWRRREDNPWIHRAETVVKPLVPEPEETDEPRCGPGPFSMADEDTTRRILDGAGFEDVRFERSDVPLKIGDDLDEAVALNMALGPAAEAIRLAGDEATALLPELSALLRDALAEFQTPDGVVAGSSTWIVTASAPSA